MSRNREIYISSTIVALPRIARDVIFDEERGWDWVGLGNRQQQILW
jgi:hypothetical protein